MASYSGTLSRTIGEKTLAMKWECAIFISRIFGANIPTLNET